MPLLITIIIVILKILAKSAILFEIGQIAFQNYSNC